MRKLFVCIALGLTTLTGNAASPLWMRDVQISPDGTEIAFCYKGDIYKVSAGGGTAIHLQNLYDPDQSCRRRPQSRTFTGRKKRISFKRTERVI